jgi:hypothetical protein
LPGDVDQANRVSIITPCWTGIFNLPQTSVMTDAEVDDLPDITSAAKREQSVLSSWTSSTATVTWGMNFSAVIAGTIWGSLQTGSAFTRDRMRHTERVSWLRLGVRLSTSTSAFRPDENNIGRQVEYRDERVAILMLWVIRSSRPGETDGQRLLEMMQYRGELVKPQPKAAHHPPSALSAFRRIPPPEDRSRVARHITVDAAQAACARLATVCSAYYCRVGFPMLRRPW